MPTDPRPPARDVRRASNRLLDVLRHERTADGAPTTDPATLGPGRMEANTRLIHQAEGALMLHYGIDSHQAFAVLVGWARISDAPVPTIAHTLLHGICEGNPQTEIRHRSLVRWLESQLRDGDPDHAQLWTAPVRCEPAYEAPRSG